jgi:NADH-quinone oxidoreductase subunit N
MNYFITVMLVSFLLSFIGIPPFAGFFIKMNIFIEVIKSCHYFIFIILGFISVINAVFYLRLIRFLLFNKENDIKLSS